MFKDKSGEFWVGVGVFLILAMIVMFVLAPLVRNGGDASIEREHTKQVNVKACTTIEDEVTRSQCVREVAG